MQEHKSDIEMVKARFKSWRESRPTMKSAIPNELWREAIGLQESMSPSQIAKALKLDYNRLREKIMIHNRNPNSGFIEIDLPSRLPTESSLEWVRPDGAILRAKIVGGDLNQIVSSFLGGGK